MTSVLIADDDEALGAALLRDLGRRGLFVAWARSEEEARRLLKAEWFDVVLLGLPIADVERIIGGGDSKNRRPYWVLCCSDTGDGVRKRAVAVGIWHVLRKPFGPQHVLAVLAHTATGVAPGERRSLIDQMQAAHRSRQSIELEFVGETVGRVVLCDGEIVHAAFGGLHGEDALQAILDTRPTPLVSPISEAKERSIRRPFQTVLFDALRKLDEREQPAMGRNG
ncbi:MAG TPA: DUF4388 domain-containing protein [Polyangiaceae bacterium]|nr:DUF4388 domain-containing protein [Polyangiaceae bacterium]